MVQAFADGPHGSVPLRVYRASAPTALLLWLHGGGFISGDLDMAEADGVATRLAEHGVTVVTAGYRLCLDGVHHPVPGDDVLAAFAWCREHAEELGVEAGRCAIGGASAGGLLAAVAAIRQRDAGERPPDSLVLCYPILHATLPPPDADLAARLVGLPPELERMNAELPDMIAAYLGPGTSPDDPHAVPAAAELRGLPPSLVIGAEVDLLRPSGEAFAAALAASGAGVGVLAEPGTLHGYLNAPEDPALATTIARIVRWLTGGSSILAAAQVTP